MAVESVKTFFFPFASDVCKVLKALGFVCQMACIS